MTKKPHPLSGKPLRDLLRGFARTLRSRIAVRPAPTADATALGALRYLGANLESGAEAALLFMRDLSGSGLLRVLRFSADDLAQALLHMADTRAADVLLQSLAAEVHREAVAARARVAVMTVQLEQSRQSLLESLLVDEPTKQAVRDAGDPLGRVLAAHQSTRQQRRSRNAAARALSEDLRSSAAQVQELQEEEALRVAQKDLQLQVLEGQPLRPADLVIAKPPRAPGRR